jgi:hypothetical protein
MLNWNGIYSRVFALIDNQGNGAYFSGGRFILKLREVVDPYFPAYNELIEDRRRRGKSTSRRDYFKDILFELDETRRAKVVISILSDTEHTNPELASDIRKMLGGEALAPMATVPAVAWNAGRLNEFLTNIDAAIAAGDYERAVGLSYTCLEGFLGSFVRAKFQRERYENEIITLAKEVRQFLKDTIVDYPDELLNLVTATAHAVDRARNRFSEAHFANESGSWMATYVRDLVNSEIRLLLHFM